MKIQDLQQPYRALAEMRREQQKDSEWVKRYQQYYEIDEDMGHAFEWKQTKEGNSWWYDTIEGEYPEIPAASLEELKEWQKEQGTEPNEDAEVKDQYDAFLWANTKEGHSFWHTVWINNYPPIPPDSLKDIPLQVRWDSGERFRHICEKTAVIGLHTFTNGVIAVYCEGIGEFLTNQNYFFMKYEPIPSEPQTRWVNVWVENSGSATTIVNDAKGTNATMSFQQQLINSKWVNV